MAFMAAFASLLLRSADSPAQRTMVSQEFLTAQYLCPFTGPGDCGLEMTYGRYLLSSLWDAGVCGAVYSRPIGDAGVMRYAHLTAGCEWLRRLAATRTRSISLYAGGGVFLGYEAYDPFGRLPSHIETGLGSGAFLYGVHLRADAEFFILEKVAAVVSFRLPVNVSSAMSLLRPGLMAGLRLDL